MCDNNEPLVGERLSKDNTTEADRQVPNRSEGWRGNVCEKKGDNCIRIMTQNINSIGIDTNLHKINEIKGIVEDQEIDIIGIQETNVCWYNCQHKEKLRNTIMQILCLTIN